MYRQVSIGLHLGEVANITDIHCYHGTQCSNNTVKIALHGNACFSKYWTNSNFDLMITLDEKLKDNQSYYD